MRGPAFSGKRPQKILLVFSNVGITEGIKMEFLILRSTSNKASIRNGRTIYCLKPIDRARIRDQKVIAWK